MTPQEIFEYKNRWRATGHEVVVNQDFDYQGKDWCRRYLGRHEWSFKPYAYPDDSHQFLFEQEEKAKEFKKFYEDRL